MTLSGLYIILASIIWGVDGYVRHETPLNGNLLIALETTIAGILLLIFLWVFKREHIKKIKNLKALVGMILLGGVGGSWCFVQALASTQSLGFVFVLIGLQPLFTILSSAFLLGERPRGAFYAFAATTIFASILLTLGDTGFELDIASLSAYIYALMTATLWGISTPLTKIVISHNSHLYALALRFFFTGMICWIIVLLTKELPNMSELTEKIIGNPLNILFLIFISDILSMAIYFRGLRDMPAALASILELAFPLTGFIIDYMLYDVVPSPMKTVAAFTILMSIVILPYCHFIEEKTDKAVTA